MKKLIYTILISGILSSWAVAEYSVKNVYDGDTIKLVDYTKQQPFNKISVRILGIDTPELKGAKCKLEHNKGIQARDYLRGLLAKYPYRIEFKKWGKYGGRVLGNVWLNINKREVKASKLLLDAGLAIPYHGKKKVFDWCK